MTESPTGCAAWKDAAWKDAVLKDAVWKDAAWKDHEPFEVGLSGPGTRRTLGWDPVPGSCRCSETVRLPDPCLHFFAASASSSLISVSERCRAVVRWRLKRSGCSCGIDRRLQVRRGPLRSANGR